MRLVGSRPSVSAGEWLTMWLTKTLVVEMVKTSIPVNANPRFMFCNRGRWLVALGTGKIQRIPFMKYRSHRLRRFHFGLFTGPLAAAWITASVALIRAEDLPHDTRILTGKLENGVTWIYRQHDNPPGKMALMMRVGSGSLNETDAQKGLAHFMEHMCFNGSEHFPPGKLIPYFESIGMQFGADLNAFTSFDETAYMLFTPDTKAEQIDKALLVLSDYAFRVTLPEDEINKERGVVLEEARSGKSAFQRIRDKLWPELFSGSRFADRLPIGDEKIIATAQRPFFEDYYRTFYRPENITVVLVGDAKPDDFIPLIKKWFGEYKPTAAPRKEMGPEFKPFTRERAIVVTDPEMAYCQVQMLNIRPGRPPTTTVERARTDLIEALSGWIIGRRFDDRVKKGLASYRAAGAGAEDFFHDAVLVAGYTVGEPKDWSKMLDEMETEIARAREYGFTEHELALAKKNLLADAERAVRTESTRNAREVINEIISSVNNRTPVLSAQQNLDLDNEVFPTIQASEVSSTFREEFAPGTSAYVVTTSGKAGAIVPTRDEVAKVADAALARKVVSIKEDDSASSLLASEPKPGKLSENTLDADLGITSAWLDNGVRVHHRFMDYKKDSILVSISLAGGEIEETAENRGLTEVASLAVNEAATHRLASSAIRDLMTGKNIGVSAGSAGDSLVLQVTGSPKDLEAGLQEAYALLTDGIIEDSAFKNWRLSTLQGIEQREKIPQAKATEAREDLLSGGDPRRAPLTKANVEALSAAKAQAWFERLRGDAPIEVAVVGDMKLEVAQPLIEKYLGSLPRRGRSADNLRKLRLLHRKPGPLSCRVEVGTVTPQAIAIAGFASSEGRNAADSRALALAGNILTSKLIKRVREDLSLVYSISANNIPAWIYEDGGRFGSGAPCDPANAPKVMDEIMRMFKEFAAGGPTDEELANGKKQIANHLDESMREPSYWSSILSSYDLQGRNLDEEKRAKEAFAALTKEQVREVFQKYFTPSRTYEVVALPVKPKE